MNIGTLVGLRGGRRDPLGGTEKALARLAERDVGGRLVMPVGDSFQYLGVHTRTPKDVADSQVMVRSFDDSDFVSGTNIALDCDPQVGAWPPPATSTPKRPEAQDLFAARRWRQLRRLRVLGENLRRHSDCRPPTFL